MGDLVIIPLGTIGTLELPRHVYERYLRPVATMPAAAVTEATAAKLVTAKVLAAALSLPRSCVYQYAKVKRIPSIRLGKHIRFDTAAVRAALQTQVG